MNEFIEYIDKKVKQLQQEESMLKCVDKKDEANLVKVQINVYGICKTVYQAFEKTKRDIQLRDDYLNKLEEFRMGWQESLDKAQKHDDVKKKVIEELKLQALQDVCSKYTEE